MNYYMNYYRKINAAGRHLIIVPGILEIGLGIFVAFKAIVIIIL